MCEAYTTLKHDYLYRGDVFESVPFVGIEPPVLLEADHHDKSRPSFIPEEKHARAFSGQSLVCAANYQRRLGVLVSRTCEAAKTGGKKRVFPALHVAPIRPFKDFGQNDAEIAAYIDGILNGFPPKEEGGERQECYRFLVIPECREHAMAAGVISLREAQPIHSDFLCGAKKIARLSAITVGTLANKLYAFFQQSEQDFAEDAAPETDESVLITDYKRRRAIFLARLADEQT